MKRSIALTKGHAVLLSVAGLFILLAGVAFAAVSEPQGPTGIVKAGSGRYQNNSNSFLIQAEAGNVTALKINQTRSTEAWQGYYGNITGTITLDDANNMTMYDWSLPNPTGEVYASNASTVAWPKVYCINASQNGSLPVRPGGPVSNINGSQIELNFGINVTDRDGLNETFNDTYADATGFRVGSITIDVLDGCSLAHPYTNEAYDSSGWQEVLLSDNESLVFTALVRNDANGFEQGSTDTFDFQMLVLENGHTGSEGSPTNYYFFVELA